MKDNWWDVWPIAAVMTGSFAIWKAVTSFDSRYAKSHNMRDALQTITSELAVIRQQNSQMLERYIQSIERHNSTMERFLTLMEKRQWDGNERRRAYDSR